jgi:hypothetical protein
VDIKEIFAKYNNEFTQFELIANPRSRRPDIFAFRLLDELVPGEGDMVLAAEHDVIFLDINLEKLEAVATEEQLRDLHRCGVRFDDNYGCLSMYV